MSDVPPRHADVGLVLSLALRLLTHSENRFARFVTWVSFIGLGLGVMILTVVVTVMNGFDHELKTRLLQSIPHVTIADVGLDDPVAAVALNKSGVLGVHRYYRGLGAITALGEVHPVVLYAADRDGLVNMRELNDHMLGVGLAALAENSSGLVLGAPLARALRVNRGDVVLMMGVETDEDIVRPRMMKFEMIDAFFLGAEPDYNLVVLNLDHFPAGQWKKMGEVGLQLTLADPLLAGQVSGELSDEFPQLKLGSWETQYGELFQAVQLEKSMMFVLLLLVVAIAAFNIVAGQTMLVNDKRRSIAILRTMGCTQSVIRWVFLLQGGLISLFGTILGLLAGLFVAQWINQILSFVESVSGMHLLDGSFFVEVPTLVSPFDLLVIGLMSAGLCLLSAWAPARRAAELDPVVNLH
ncbi:MAG: FtsX-like permease family protein [Gammaproteobacteria bacterium]|nr:FtsX-like permease family protein [Gammaproteobacteria bacterium]